jgi:membrane-associated protein
MARFVPVVRTFVPTVAGVSRMDYATFLRWNVIGGVLWGGCVPLLGYFFGSIQWVRDNFEVAVIGIVFISLLPMLYEMRHVLVATGQRLLGRKATDDHLASAEIAETPKKDSEPNAG